VDLKFREGDTVRVKFETGGRDALGEIRDVYENGRVAVKLRPSLAASDRVVYREQDEIAMIAPNPRFPVNER
jgi:hypothetical protein